MIKRDTVPTNIGFGILKELLYGIFRNIIISLRKRPALNSLKVKQFFINRSKKNNFNDFTESTKNWYLMGVSTILKELTSNEVKKHCVLDLGSGRGGLLNYIKNNGFDFTYLGVDFDSEAVRNCNNIEKYSKEISFQSIDVLEFLETNSEKFDITFIINLLPYVANLSSLFNLLQKSNLTSIIICEPYPSPYWENTFGGFSIRLRRPSKLKRFIQSNGYHVISEHRLYSGQLFKWFFIRINTTYLITKN